MHEPFSLCLKEQNFVRRKWVHQGIYAQQREKNTHDDPLNEEFVARMALILKNGAHHLPNITAHYMKRWSTFYLVAAVQYIFYCWFHGIKWVVVVVARIVVVVTSLTLYIFRFLFAYYSIFHIKYKHKVQHFFFYPFFSHSLRAMQYYFAMKKSKEL